MRKFFTIIGVTVVVIFSLTTLAISQMDRKAKDDLYSQIELFSYALTTLQADYVDELSPKDLIYGSLRGMLGSLDPHSQFLDQEEYTELKTETQGKFGGLGIEISIRDGLLTVITPIEDTPAWTAGVKAGDRIVKIGDDLTRNITLSDAVKKLRGDPGTDIKITVLREDTFELKEFTITREVIHIQDVKDVQLLTDKIGYIRLTEFREDSAKEFKKGIDKLTTEGATSLIIDLRNNPGGLLNVANKITEFFLPAGMTIVSTKGRRSAQNSVVVSTNKNAQTDLPIVVLINEGSASGSEIFAGALKDNGRAVIVGETSFGKGSVQSVIPMPDGSGLRLTTSKYFTPSGVSIHGTGITPDIIVERIVPAEDAPTEREQKVEQIFDTLEEKTPKSADDQKIVLEKRAAEAHDLLMNDNQVQAAINVLKGITAYKKLGKQAVAPATTAPEIAAAGAGKS